MPKSDEDMKLAKVYDRINGLESKVDETNGYLKGVVESNEKLIKLFSKSLYILAFIAIVLLFALIYGAVGERGLKAVRESVPALPASSDLEAIPVHPDTDKWRRAKA